MAYHSSMTNRATPISWCWKKGMTTVRMYVISHNNATTALAMISRSFTAASVARNVGLSNESAMTARTTPTTPNTAQISSVPSALYATIVERSRTESALRSGKRNAGGPCSLKCLYVLT
eukprot:6795964-Prymnesium_polylepis.2